MQQSMLNRTARRSSALASALNKIDISVKPVAGGLSIRQNEIDFQMLLGTNAHLTISL